MVLLVLVAALVLDFALGLVDLLLLDALGVLDVQVVVDVGLGVLGNVLDAMVVLDVLDAEKLVLPIVGLVLAVVLIAQKIVTVDAQVAIVVLPNVKEDVVVVALAVLVDVLDALDAAEAADPLVEMDALLIVALDVELFVHLVAGLVKVAQDAVVVVADVMDVLTRVLVDVPLDALEIAMVVVLTDAGMLVKERVMEQVQKVVLHAKIVVRIPV